jgi:hypothetical protein
MDKTKLYSGFIFFILIIKVLFIISAVSLAFLKHKNKSNNNKGQNKILVYVKDTTQLIFKLSVSILLIILFNPRQKYIQEIDSESKLILYLYGIMTIIELIVEKATISGSA